MWKHMCALCIWNHKQLLCMVRVVSIRVYEHIYKMNIHAGIHDICNVVLPGKVLIINFDLFQIQEASLCKKIIIITGKKGILLSLLWGNMINWSLVVLKIELVLIIQLFYSISFTFKCMRILINLRF